MERSNRPAAAGDDGQSLVALAQADPAHFEALYRKHYRAVAQYIFRRVGDVHTAEDLAAETFIDAWRGLRRYRATGVPFEHWLLRIATNRVHRWGRQKSRAGRRPRVLRAAPRADDGSEAELRRALNLLSQSHQDVLYLHHVEELSVETVSGVLGCGVGTVKSRLHRAREALRRELERLEVES